MKGVLLNLVRQMAKQPLDWNNPATVRLQYEARWHFTAQMPTLELIAAVCTDEEESVSFMMALTEIMAAPEQSTKIGAQA